MDNVTNALIARKDQFIKWPTDNHTQNKIRYGFFQQANFPNVLGCIDGTHVRIQRTRGRISIGKVTPALMCKLFVTMKVIILIIKLFLLHFSSLSCQFVLLFMLIISL